VELERYLLSRLELSNSAGACSLVPRALLPSLSHVVLELASTCREARSLRYDLFFEHDRTHQGYLHVAGPSELDHVFSNARRNVALMPGNEAWPLLSYLAQGVHHVLIGADHILFLLTLFFAAVWRPGERRELPPSLRDAVAHVARIVTAFTAAHSFTLALMALGAIEVPSRWVEVLIAFSIVAAAANNLWPLVTRRLWWVAFGFGLVHGLGFGGILVELEIPEPQKLVALVGFNLGVELGQLAVAGLCLPLAIWLQRRPRYGRFAFNFGSALIGVIGLVWSLERALEADWSSRVSALWAAPSPATGRKSPERPCATLTALSEPALYDGVMSGSSSDPAVLAGRRAYELACAGQLDRAADLFAELLAPDAPLAPAPVARGWLLRAYAEVEDARGGRYHGERLLELAALLWREQAADGPLADTLARAGELMARQEQWADVFRLYNEARTLHERSGDTAGLARDLARLGDVLTSAADTRGAKRMYDQARTAYERAGDPAGAAAQYTSLAMVARLESDPTTAAQMYRRAIELHRQGDARLELASTLEALARTHLGTGQFDEARALYEQANTLETELGRTRHLARNYNQLGNLHQTRGELGTAGEMYRRALGLSEAAGDTNEAANNWANLASIQHRLGRIEEARTMYERSLSLFEQSGAKPKMLRVRGLLTSLEARPVGP
jgi:tetratricopeptide (TPR) repeat protein